MQCYGENGIIKKAQHARELYQNSSIAEETEMNTLLAQYENMMAGVSSSGENSTEENTIVTPPTPPEYKDNALPSTPRLATGMTKVKWNGSKWQKVTDDTEEWYDYDNKEWANVVLGDATWNDDGTLNEDEPYTQLVWIPRYAYKITSLYHTASDDAGDIEIVFIDTSNQNKSGTTTYSTTYPSATTGGGMDDYVVHPAFDYGGTHLSGFWVGKFESSHTGCTTTASTGEASYTGSEVMCVKAGVTSWRKITIGNMYATCLAMNASGNVYGLSSDDTVIDSHLCKNDEWGAVAYLSYSTYGKNSEVYINNSSTYITGNAGSTVSASSADGITNAYDTTAGQLASTTGNITGVYDMSGGAWENTAAYVDNGNSYLTTYGGDLVSSSTASKYRNVYSIGSSDSYSNNYAVSTPANGFYGDAIYETSSRGENGYGWCRDDASFPRSYYPFFMRGGDYSRTKYAGVLSLCDDDSGTLARNGFRVVVPVL